MLLLLDLPVIVVFTDTAGYSLLFMLEKAKPVDKT